MAVLGPEVNLAARPASANGAGEARTQKSISPKDGGAKDSTKSGRKDQIVEKSAENVQQEQAEETPQLERVSEEELQAINGLLMCDEELPYWQNSFVPWSPANKKDVDLLNNPRRPSSQDSCRADRCARRHLDDRSPDNVCDMFEPNYMVDTDFFRQSKSNLSESFSRMDSLDGSQRLRESIRRDLDDLIKEEQEGHADDYADRACHGYLGSRGGLSLADLDQKSNSHGCEINRDCGETAVIAEDQWMESSPDSKAGEGALREKGPSPDPIAPSLPIGKSASDGKESSTVLIQKAGRESKVPQPADQAKWAVNVSSGYGLPEDHHKPTTADRVVPVSARPLSCIPEGSEGERSTSALSQLSQGEGMQAVYTEACKVSEPMTYRGIAANSGGSVRARPTMSAPSGSERIKRVDQKAALPAIATHGNSHRLQTLDQSVRDRKLKVLNEEKDRNVQELASRPLAIRSINTSDIPAHSSTLRSRRMGPQPFTQKNMGDMPNQGQKAKHDMKVNVVELCVDFMPAPPPNQQTGHSDRPSGKGRAATIQQKPSASSGVRGLNKTAAAKTMHIPRRPL
mmetsp:Transcript_48770/g.76131  ORF Transcript_48770/g.76131 Transcript_48770/m.76131 type:complete len:571 (-) Transcript_48770:49-1761(-)|eukprot:CAMPEP_0184310298 /NCGR_PEP_ID=MMETSP1049-20130417/26785_1 /TAXON_ID=77928 /ORGANISM="Proteomonas sulcata, Strain CCMP704" /LENGTH=570 /DNA_ID=CAMNT_0026624185 /DNA_START=315 /DNA_END=2027 /DNA_ORIENTATION=-